MNAKTQKPEQLFRNQFYLIINGALAELDLRGTDKQVTKAMAIVTEAFFRHESGRDITVKKLLAAAERAAANHDDC